MGMLHEFTAPTLELDHTSAPDSLGKPETSEMWRPFSESG